MKTEFFQSIGMTNSEINVYNALLSEGASDARTICSHSSVPFGKIYDILYSLENRGLVKVQNSRPKMFMAAEPKAGVKSLLETKEKELQSLYDQATNVEEELRKIYRAKPNGSMFWSVAMAYDERKSLLRTVINEAKKEVLIYKDAATLQKMVGEVQSGGQSQTTHIVQTLKNEFRPLFDNMEKNVTFRMLIGGVCGGHEFVSLIRKNLNTLPLSCEIRVTNHIAGSFILIDDEKMLLDLRNPVDPLEKMAMIYIWKKSLGTVLKHNFEKMWENAREFNR
jgi:predicted transcriptional regulator